MNPPKINFTDGVGRVLYLQVWFSSKVDATPSPWTIYIFRKEIEQHHAQPGLFLSSRKELPGSLTITDKT